MGLGVTVVTHDVDVARAAARGGADLVQVRAKVLDDEALLALTLAVIAACSEHGTGVVVNDRLDVAIAAGAEGVHLGQAELHAQVIVPSGMLLGISVDDAEQALRAASVGADYLGVTVFATATKRDARPVGLAGLSAIVAATDVPVVGIGGITASNAAQVLDAGATGIAVVSYVGAADDMVAATRELVAIVQGG